MSLSSIKYENQVDDVKSEFWTKVERICGDIPILIKLVLGFNGYDSLLSLRRMNCEEKEFFEGIEESVRNLQEEDEDDDFRVTFENVLRSNYQRIKNFKLKPGHKTLIINLCKELQNINVEEFNGKLKKIDEQQNFFYKEITSINNDEKKGSPKKKQILHLHHQMEVTKDQLEPEFHSERSPKKQSDEFKSEASPVVTEIHEALELNDDNEEMVQYIYETEDEEEDIKFTSSNSEHDTEFLAADTYDQDGEVVEMVFDEVQQDEAENGEDSLYMSEQIIKSEANQYEHSSRSRVYDIDTDYLEQQKSGTTKFKRPRHMYSSEFLAGHSQAGRIGTPGRRRPKLQKTYPNTDEGLLDRWGDLIRQSCQVIIPSTLLNLYDISCIEITKIGECVWEVACPMCTKKVKLQLTTEGKYVNYKRSNFERHLRNVHYRQIEISSKSDENSMKIVKVESQNFRNQKDGEDDEDSSFDFE